ncbi:hypothetical protein OOJ91_33610 [Micromonospora lupini]|uniref:hypothetical protein n=1 Tax=Micromonospora lupini TaxID=285679 RepID=UPI002255DEA4|nr:hypothetical protein [Micromonospora lupini]MCX5070784.1 hypothetical protein [Micromonospora lupini]
MTAKAAAAWADLNDRQRTYLAAIYNADQEREREIAGKRRNRVEVPPAAEWRKLRFSLKLPRGLFGYTTIQDVLRAAGEHDSGAGATLAALTRRGLVTTEHGWADLGIMVVECVYVTLTTPGRAAARAALPDDAKPVKKPTGLLAEWLWESLARLYRAGEGGMTMGLQPRDTPMSERTPSWTALQKLRDNQRDGSYIREFLPEASARSHGVGGGYWVHITPAGRRHFEVHHACYRELYPDVNVVDPEVLAGAHSGLADHSPSLRPRHLVREPDWRLLARLTWMEKQDRCPFRDRLIFDYESWNRMSTPEHRVEVPDRIRAIPVGLGAHAVKKIARSTAVVDRLKAYPGGGLVELVDVPARGRHYGPNHPETLPLVCLTDTGRAHVAEHLDAYLRLYPDVPVGEINES